MNYQAHSVAKLPVSSGEKSLMGSILAEFGKLRPEDVDRVLHLQNERGVRFGEAARYLGLITDGDIQQVLARQFSYPYLQPGQGQYPAELVAAYQPFSEQVETMRTVRMQLMQHWFSGSRKMLAVASASQGEGTSFFAANLAVVFSQLGLHTLLIDANLRSPHQHNIFRLSGRQGLSDILANRAGLETVSKLDAFHNLSVLQAGTLPPNPQELVSRTSFRELTASAVNRYDVILLDVSAFSKGADALTVASHTGGVLLVCRQNRTGVTGINTVGAQLARAGVQVVGTVLVDF